ncbi:MAG TPA: VWA domain-containing protein [Vicinamibacterales bacterium]|nr:VWA domain-containing protein [Vicinamibacterales bacterium]
MWWGMTQARTNFNARQKRVQAGARAFVLVLLVLALAQPVAHRSTDRLSIVYLVDASHSVSASSLASAAERIAALDAELEPEHSRILAFAGSVVPVADGAALVALETDAAAIEQLQRGESSLGPALDAARRALLPGHASRIVLFSDGHATDASAELALSRLSEQRIPVHTYPSAVRDLRDSWVDDVRFEAALVQGERAGVIVTMGAQAETTGRLELRVDGRTAASKDISMGPGMADVRMDVTFDAPGSRLVEAVWTPDADALPDNNVRRIAADVLPPTRVLYVEGRPASAGYLRGALTREGMDVTLAAAAALPASRQGYQGYDTVIVSDVDRRQISDAQMRALESWVRDDGGGFVMVGGESVYGKDGYNDSVIENILPVTFEIKDKPEDVAVVIVFDKSWSMAGPKVELSKEAAIAAVEVLADNHQLGFITFNHLFDWNVKVMEVGPNRQRIHAAIKSIEPSGHTIIFPAIEQSFLALRDVDARVKHVILMSDGRSYADQYEALVRKMVDEKMTVSTIAVGTEADRELLRNIAVWGKGRSYEVDDPREVPQVFVKETEQSARPALSEQPFTPSVKDASLFEGVDIRSAPELSGYTGTKLKETATELLATDKEEPLLATWPYGLGRTAVFTSDAKDRWASRWITWRGYGPFWTRVVRAVRRQPSAPLQMTVDTERRPHGVVAATLRLDARTSDGGYQNLLRPAFAVRTVDGAERRVEARQIAPGAYEADVVLDGATGYAIVAEGVESDEGNPAVTIAANYPEEYRFRPADARALSAMSIATGGRYEPDAAALRPGAGDRSSVPTRLWPGLLMLALAAYLLDLLLRRVRIFEREEFAL